MILNTYANETKICCFCETVYSNETVFCFGCNEYKGIMTIAEFDKFYGYLDECE